MTLRIPPWQDVKIALRVAVGYAWGMLSYPAAWLCCRAPKDEVAKAVADLLIVGFYGKTTASPSARLLARQATRGQVGSVFFVQHNIGTRAQASDLVALFRQGPHRPRLAIDHEGGVVQRLRKPHQFTVLPRALHIAETHPPDEAKALYATAGAELASFGFDINLAPVLDFHSAGNPAIGRPQRAFGTDPKRIAVFAQAFVDGFAEAGIKCAAKHFPGHGYAVEDSHFAPADITSTWSTAELAPFEHLCNGTAPPALMMTGHLRHDTVDPSGRPATLSRPMVTDLLRGDLGFDGVVMTDDIDMGAISWRFPRREAFIEAIAAGHDLIMIKNLFNFDPLLPHKAVWWVRRAIREGRLTERQVLRAASRVRGLD